MEAAAADHVFIQSVTRGDNMLIWLVHTAIDMSIETPQLDGLSQHGLPQMI
jgi:hypothetical protein